MTEVRISPDLRQATVFVMPLGGRDEMAVMAALARARGFFRRQIAHSVHLKFVPDLTFRIDRSFEQADRIARVLREPEVSHAIFARTGRATTIKMGMSEVGRRRGNAVNGWLVIDKPAGITSAAVVSTVRRATGAAKAGHGGTLDPLATGLLPIAFGEATKTVSYVVDGLKTYRFTVRWGEQRNTDDAEGEITEVSEARPSEAEIRDMLDRFRGEIEQVPPTFSAIKVAGERAYASRVPIGRSS